MAQLTTKSKDYEKFTRELQIALEKEIIRQQQSNRSELGEQKRQKTEAIKDNQEHGDDTVQLKKPMKKSILRKIDIFLNPALLSKSAVCKHDHGCFENTMR